MLKIVNRDETNLISLPTVLLLFLNAQQLMEYTTIRTIRTMMLTTATFFQSVLMFFSKKNSSSSHFFGGILKSSVPLMMNTESGEKQCTRNEFSKIQIKT